MFTPATQKSTESLTAIELKAFVKGMDIQGQQQALSLRQTTLLLEAINNLEDYLPPSPKTVYRAEKYEPYSGDNPWKS